MLKKFSISLLSNGWLNLTRQPGNLTSLQKFACVPVSSFEGRTVLPGKRREGTFQDEKDAKDLHAFGSGPPQKHDMSLASWLVEPLHEPSRCRPRCNSASSASGQSKLSSILPAISLSLSWNASVAVLLQRPRLENVWKEHQKLMRTMRFQSIAKVLGGIC